MKILIVHASAGYGHKKIAEVLADGFRARGLRENELEVVDGLDFTPWIFKTAYPAFYFHSVKNTPRLWGWFYELLDQPLPYTLLKPFRSFANLFFASALLKKVEREKPDVVVCAHFLSAELLSRAKTEGRISSHIVILITDFFPHTFWVHPGADDFWVMGDEGVRSLLRRGVDQHRAHAGGIPVGEDFKPTGRREEILKKWNFDSERLTLLLTSGSFGLGQQKRILQLLEDFKDRVQCFVVCGQNKRLEKELRDISWAFPVQIFGFIPFMAELMEASDLLLAKSGGSTTTESLAKGLPMIISEPIPGQETRNAKFLLGERAAFTMEEPGQISAIIRSVLDHPEILDEKRAEIKRIAKPNATDDLVTFILEKVELLKESAPSDHQP